MSTCFDDHLGRQTLKILRKHASKTHQIDVITGSVETHGSVLLRSIRMAESFKSKGIQLGDVIVICGQNHFDLSIPFIASLYIGAMSVNLAPGITITEIKHIFSLIRPKLIFADFEKLSNFERALIELNIEAEIISFGNHQSKFTQFNDFIVPTGTEDNFECEDFDTATTTAFAICTSGSTGLPKLVEKVHKDFTTQFIIHIFLNNVTNLTENGVIFNASTMFWVSGISNVLSSCLIGNSRINSSVPLTPDIMKKAIEKYQPNFMLCSPSTLSTLFKYSQMDPINFSSFKSIVCGGGLLGYEIAKSFQKLLPNGTLIIAYGSTEIGIVSINYNIQNFSIGKLFPDVKWKIINPDSGDVLKVNHSGELCIQSKNKCNYYNDLKSTENSVDSDGYFRTGDLVHWQENDELRFIDRKKELIKYKNFQIAPAEIENLINTMPGVTFVGVLGIQQEDDEVPIAVVQKEPGSDITAQKIKDIVKDNLSDPKSLRGGVIFVENFPLTPSGKVDRKALKEMISVL